MKFFMTVFFPQTGGQKECVRLHFTGGWTEIFFPCSGILPTDEQRKIAYFGSPVRVRCQLYLFVSFILYRSIVAINLHLKNVDIVVNIFQALYFFIPPKCIYSCFGGNKDELTKCFMKQIIAFPSIVCFHSQNCCARFICCLFVLLRNVISVLYSLKAQLKGIERSKVYGIHIRFNKLFVIRYSLCQ